MPELNGWEVAAHIRAIDTKAHMIFITGWGEGIDQSKLEEAGIDQILYKPFRLEQLTEALERATIGRVSL
jgi:CheY-like chemotaxis protein